MARTKSSKAWLQRHVTDPYVRRAKALGYRSRSAFKLLEIDAKDRLLGTGLTVVDLGAAPGGWSQLARERVGPGGRVIAIDVLEMEPLAGVEFLRADFASPEGLAAMERALAGGSVDLVLSDMAPNLSGVASADQARSIHLCELAVEFACAHLKPGGALLVKVFQGSGFPQLHADLKRRFQSVVSRKPGASRGESTEMYLLARSPRKES